MKNILACMLAAVIFGSCAQRVLPPLEYISWIEDEHNGMLVEKEIGGHIFQLLYKPAAYEVLLQTRNATVNEEEFAAMKNEIDDLQYFKLTVIPEDHKELAMSGMADENEYSSRITYMMSEMQYDFALIDGTDTLSCVFFHAERNFNLSPENHILLGFEKSGAKSISDKTLFYNDQLLGCGPVLITIEAEDLENIPELKIAE